ncbi:hypothetical protein SAMN06265348_10625 [Pedobacter westerhofensis]|uniref:Uncharacterized protein n=1 Tax=Pedobacter westerhofensis TaxID=425512 RepID=A0A521DN61_9SPHI|nr:ABC-three component system middle component 2 [Pedobacter westerhofensis]SMO73169.1 hypothetical protein SAMN06265348_10625 [Pedobacter westerhofensis]
MSKIYSSDLEISLRLMAILQFYVQAPLTIERLVVYDFLILHGNDIFPELHSLHPKSPNSSNEFLIKRELFKRGLHLLVSKELIKVNINKTGISYQGSELTVRFCEKLNSPYSRKLYPAVQSVISTTSLYSDLELENRIKTRLLNQDPVFKNESLFLNYSNG